jgi:Tfp pilus assembly PilM family ATPase
VVHLKGIVLFRKQIMGSHDEISFMKKLLEAIRRAPLVGSFIPSSEKVTLGVDIGTGEVRLVKVRISGDRWKLLDCLNIPFEPGISKGGLRFHEFLRSSVSTIADPAGECDVWTLVSTANLDVRYIKIPKVPKAKIASAVYWTIKRETNFDEKESILDFEVQGEVLEKGIAKIGILAYIIPRQDLDEIRDVFSRSGLTVRGITAAPFAIQNLFRSGCEPSHDKPIGVLYIGNEHSRIDIFLKGNLVLTRDMKAGIDSVIEAYVEGAYEETLKVDEAADEGPLTVSADEADERLVEAKTLLLSIFSRPFSPDESIGSTGLREEDIFEMIKPALSRLATQVERTFKHYSLTVQNESVETIYVSCAAGHWNRSFDFIANQLGVERQVLDPLDQAAILSDEVPVPATIAERIPFTTAVGLALSNNARTPNLVFTYRDKEELGKIDRINRGVFYVFLAIILILTGVFFWQERLAGQKEAEVTRLQRELEGYNPQPNQNMIAALAAKVIAERRALVERSNRVLWAAVIGELASLTPPNVRLLSARADVGSKPEERDKKGASTGETKGAAEIKKEAKRGLVLEGIVTGRRDALEACLAGYLMKLSASRLFVHPVMSSNAIESYPDYGEVLRFSLQIGLR